jgi:hypothetical protein
MTNERSTMVRRLFVAGLCALGVAGLSAASASAELPYLVTPGKIQVWSSDGLVRTIVCTTTTTAPGCDYRGVLGKSDDQIPLITTYVHDGEDIGYRILDPRGKWYQEGGSLGSLHAMGHADAAHGPGWALAEPDQAYLQGPHWLDGYPNQGHINDHITEQQQIQEELGGSNAEGASTKRHVHGRHVVVKGRRARHRR